MMALFGHKQVEEILPNRKIENQAQCFLLLKRRQPLVYNLLDD
jgi:hypothetical protein